jgi:hypothetical protein
LNCQGFDSIGPDPDHIAAIFAHRQKGVGLEHGTPVIIVVDEGENVRLEPIYSGEVSQWTAISHVWADGLGNLSRNAIPSYQLREIARLCKKTQTQNSCNYCIQLEG